MAEEVKKEDAPEVAEAPKEEVKEEKKEAPKEEVKEEKKETPAEAPKEEAPEVEVPAKFKKLVEEVENMSVLELHELVKVLENKFGVSAAAMAVAGPAAGGEEAEEKSDFNVELTGIGESKIGVMKAVKEILGLGLKEAKDLVECVPTVLKEGVPKADAEEMKKKIEEAGGSVELK